MSLSNNYAGTAGARQKYFKLPDFWPSSPHAWFSIVEAQFQLQEVTTEADRFTLVASVLPESSARARGTPSHHAAGGLLHSAEGISPFLSPADGDSKS